MVDRIIFSAAVFFLQTIQYFWVGDGCCQHPLYRTIKDSLI